MSEVRVAPAEEGTLPVGEAVPRAGALVHLVVGLVPLILGGVCLAYAVSLSVGTPTSPGPGLWPALASLLLLAAATWSLVFERRARDCEQFTRGTRGIALGVASLVVYVPLIGRVGFEVPTLLLLAFWLKLLGKESWLATAVVSGVCTATLYLLFVVLLGAPLPRLTF